MLYGAIEAGGTKFVCAVSSDKLDIIDRVSFPTTIPEETIPLVIEFFEKYKNDLVGIGIGSFGPIDVDVHSKTYGYIMETPKKKWRMFDFVGTIKKSLNIPVKWTTDVNAACYGEYVKGKGIDQKSVVYYTIGTGVGGGGIQQGEFIEGFSHPEMGHMLINKHPKDDFSGACPFHDNCLEGFASGLSIEKRSGIKGEEIPLDSLIWEIEADYIAQSVYNTTLFFSPNIIILGGGVMKQSHLLPMIHTAFKKLLNNYVNVPSISEYITTPYLGDDAGIVGCLALVKNNIK